VKTVGWLKKKFPDKSDRIKSDSYSQSVQEGKTIDKSAIQLVSPIDKKSFNVPSPDMYHQDTRQTAEVWECWMQSEDIEQIEITEEQAQLVGVDPTGPVYGKKYPNGRLITILPSQKLLLQDIESPYKHARHPYVRFVDQQLPRSFWGEGEVKCLMPQQRIINKVLSNIIDYNNLMANPVWITEQGNSIDPDRLTNQIAAVLQVGAGKSGTIKRDIPPAAQAGSIELLQYLMRGAETISGSSEVTQGRRPVGITAAQAIESLQEAAQTRIRLKERNMNSSLTQMAYQVIQLIFQYYTVPRIIRLNPAAGEQWPRFFEFFVEHNSDGTYKWNK
jgi:hypothetical protein